MEGINSSEEYEPTSALVDGWHETTAERPAPTEQVGAAALAGATKPAEPEEDVGVEHDRQPTPRVWIGSLADYNNGRLHGQWIDADQDGDALVDAARGIVSRSRLPDAEEWAIFDHEGFDSLEIDEYESLRTVARIVRGIREHGPAFAAWAQYVDIYNEEQLDKFEDHFRGEYYSMTNYLDTLMDDIGVHHDLDEALRAIPEDIRRYVKLDTEALAHDWSIELHVVETGEGKVWVFEP